MKPSLRNWLDALALVVLWTGFIVFARFAVKKVFTPYDMMFLRLGFAAMVALGFLAWRANRGVPMFGNVSPPRMLFLGVFGGLGFTSLAFMAFSFAPAAHGAVLMPGTLPFSTAILAWLFLGERIAGRKIACLGLILLGVLFMGYQAYTTSTYAAVNDTTWKGDLIFPFASGCWAVYVVFSRRWGVKPMDAVIIVPLVSFLMLVPFYVWLAPKNLPDASAFDILANGIFQGWMAYLLSMWLFMRVMQAFGPVKTTMLTAWAPILSSLAAVPLLDEHLSIYVVAGLLCVSFGTVVGVSSPNEPRRVEAT